MLHIADEVKDGHTNVMILSVDTDFVVIVVCCFHVTAAVEISVALGLENNSDTFPFMLTC